MKRFLYIPLALLLLALSRPVQAQLIWRGAGMLKPGQAIVQASNYLTHFDCAYNWGDEKWVDYPDGRAFSWNGSQTMIGVGVTPRLELMAHLPIHFKSNEISGIEKEASGLGDLYLKARYAVLPWAKDRHGFTVVAAVRLPTGDDKAEIALGDGSTDLALGGLYTTPWKKGFRGHLRAAYWLNGKNEADVNIGNELKFIAKLDRKFSSCLMGFLTYTHYRLSKRADADGAAMAHTQKTRNYLSPGLVWKPIKGLNVRPKVLIPFGGTGGSLFTVKPLLDLWYTFKLFG